MSSPSKPSQPALTSVSLIGKLQSLEEIITQMTREMNSVYREVQLLRAEKEVLENEMTHRGLDVKELLSLDVGRTESEMKRHIANQKAENNRLQGQMNQLRMEKDGIKAQVEKLKERVHSLELMIGSEVKAK